MTIIQEEKLSELTGSYNIYLCFGSFDPLHIGHIAYLKAASKIKEDTGRHADNRPALMVVAVMGDGYTHRKKGFSFYTAKERATIINSLQNVDKVIVWDDNTDNIDGLVEAVKPNYLCVGKDFTEKEYSYENVTTLYRLGYEVDKSSNDYVYDAAMKYGIIQVEEEIERIGAEINKGV